MCFSSVYLCPFRGTRLISGEESRIDSARLRSPSGSFFSAQQPNRIVTASDVTDAACYLPGEQWVCTFSGPRSNKKAFFWETLTGQRFSMFGPRSHQGTYIIDASPIRLSV